MIYCVWALLIYLGDGNGDFFLVLKISEGDWVMPRKNFPPWELICSNPLMKKADGHEWRILLHLIINMIAMEENIN